ncbi:MAG: FrgA protein [Archangium sp.]|nr:FrgA protein [Archangium sp.]
MPQRLAQHLIARGLLPARVVDEALRRLGRDGGSLDTVLLEMGAVSEAGILQAVSDVSGVRLVNLADFEPNTEAGPLMPLKMARQMNVVPLSVDGTALHLACAYPLQNTQLKDVGFLLGRKLELWVALEARVRDWQQTLYGQKLEPRYEKLLRQLDPTRPAQTMPSVVVSSEASQTLEGDTESLSNDVMERIARGIVDEPVLLDKPKPKKPGAEMSSSVRKPRPKIEIIEDPGKALGGDAVGGEIEVEDVLPLGDDEPKTSVLDPTAYGRFARAEHGNGAVDSSPGTPLDEGEHSSTRVMDIPGYKNFAKEISNTPSGEFEQPKMEPPPPPPKISFPGGVLPPKKPGDSPTRRSSSDLIPVSFVQPASAPRPSAERVRPTGSKAVPRNSPAPPVAQTKAPAPQPTSKPPPPVASKTPAPRTPVPPPVSFHHPTASPQGALPRDEMDFSDVNEVISSPGAKVEVPPEPPTPPDFTKREHAPAPVPIVTQQPLELLQPVQPVLTEPQAPVQPAGTYSAPAAMPDFSQVQGILPSPPGLVPSSATEWSLAQARTALRAAVNDREALISVVLEYGRRTFEYVGAFAVMRGAAVGWDSRGETDASVIRQLAVPLDAASVFRTVALTRGSYVGPLPPDALSQHYLALLGRMPRTVFVWPVEVQSRLVAMLYGDCGARPISQRRLADFILFCQDLPTAFHELILYRKQNPQVAQTFTSSSGVMPDPGYAQDGAAAQAPPSSDSEWFNGLITLLTGPDPSERSMAMLELMKSPDSSARALAAAFPGPTGWSRLPVVELPEPDELGPLPGALARLGQAGASAVAPLLDHEDSDTRYLALLTAGSLRYPDVVDGVLRGLFDFEPDISSAARAAAAALRLLPHFQSRLPSLRQELTSTDTLRRSLAARALGVLHDRSSIEGLINLTGSEDELCAQSAGDALKEITRAGFGTHTEGWTAWWARARSMRRIEWLVEALDADDFDLRLSAIEELSRTFGDNFGYFADGPEAERAGAVARWKAVVSSRADLDL